MKLLFAWSAWATTSATCRICFSRRKRAPTTSCRARLKCWSVIVRSFRFCLSSTTARKAWGGMAGCTRFFRVFSRKIRRALQRAISPWTKRRPSMSAQRRAIPRCRWGVALPSAIVSVGPPPAQRSHRWKILQRCSRCCSRSQKPRILGCSKKRTFVRRAFSTSLRLTLIDSSARLAKQTRKSWISILPQFGTWKSD